MPLISEAFATRLARNVHQLNESDHLSRLSRVISGYIGGVERATRGQQGHKHMRNVIFKVVTGLVILASPAKAEMELSFYLGSQSSPHSRITGSHPDIGAIDSLIGWEGRSFEPPPYYGARATWWRNSDWGYGVELTHTKAYAPTAEMAGAGFNRLEFTDGHNILTLNVHRRWKGQWMRGKLTPYVSAGVGVAIPHVDIRVAATGAHTYGYQLTGPAAKLGAGANYALTDHLGLFAEYQFTWSDNDVELEGGGNLSTRIISNAVNFGISYSF